MTYIKRPILGDDEPGIHILLIGVADYAHLPGGRGAQFEPAADFQELDAPDFSCKALGEWLLDGKLTHPSLAIKSIDLLASNVRHEGVAVEKPSYANVRDAIDRWYKQGDTSHDNLLIFYFCGHGLQDGTTTHSLLCADFGLRQNDPFDHAVHYEGFESGMRACKARKQVFMLDICRTTSAEISRGFRGPGHDVVGRLPPDDLTDVAQSVIWATSGGSEAWSRNRKPSVFAEAFMKCMEGGAAVNDIHSSAVIANAASVRTAMAAYITAMGQVIQEPQHTQPTGRQFALHQFTAEFKVPVVVRCDPQQYTQSANLSCWQDGRSIKRRKAGTRYDHWLLDLPNGMYTFRAAFPIEAKEYTAANCLVYPPLMPVFIKV